MNISKLGMEGVFTFRHIRNGSVVAEWEESPNIVVDEGLIYILNTAISNVSQLSNWYIGLFKANYTPVATDDMNTFPTAAVANEATNEYAEATRPIFVPQTVNTKITKSQAVDFTFNTAVDIYGGFMASDATKGGTAGTLLAASRFPTVRNMIANDVLQVSYELQIQDI